MSFQDLPQDWPERALDDPHLAADVLDLVVSERDRRAGALAVLLCDETARLVQPVVVDGCPEDSPEEERVRALGTFTEAMGPSGSLLLAIARRDGLSIRAEDRMWVRAARQACGPHVRLLGVYVITLAGSRLVPAGEAA